MALNLIPAGEFMMGSNATDPDAYDNEFVDKAASRKEKHLVRITRPFHLGVTEVTRGQFRRFVDEAGYQIEARKTTRGALAGTRKRKRSSTIPNTPGRLLDSSKRTSTRW